MKLISIENLQPGMVLARDVSSSKSRAAISLLRAGNVLTSATITRLYRLGITQVYVIRPQQEKPMPARPLQGRQRITPRSLKRPAPLLADWLRKDSISTLTSLFSNANFAEGGILGDGKELHHVEGLVEMLLNVLRRTRGAQVSIAEIKSFDEYTYHHSLSVAILSMSIGLQMGISGRQLTRLGLAAILHDIGKASIPAEILHKPTPLTNEEHAIMQMHPHYGASYILRSSYGNEELWRAVLFHHERPDGAGYPKGLKGEQIPLWSRIIAVADVYDALTSHRPHRQPMPPSEALEFIMGGSDTMFDYNAVMALVHRLAPYPLYCWVELSTGQRGQVVNIEYPMRPIVEIFGTGEIIDLYRNHDMLNIVIRRVIMPYELDNLR